MAQVAIAVGISVALTLLTYLLTPSTNLKAGDPTLSLPGSDYGRRIPKPYGTVRFEINWIWPQSKEKAFTKKKKKKQGKGGATSEEILVSGNFMGIFCEGPVTLDKLLVAGKVQVGSGVSPNWGDTYFTFFDGGINQMPWPYAAGIDGIENTPAYHKIVGCAFEQLPLKKYGDTFPNRVSLICTDTELGAWPVLGNIVKDLCVRAGYQPSQIDTSELTETVHGFIFNNNGNEYKDAITQLGGVYQFFSTTLPSGVLSFRKYERPENEIIYIKASDLAAHEEGQDYPESIHRTILDGVELPRKVWIKFYNPEINYDKDSLPVEYFGATGTSEQTLDTDIVMTPSSAKTQATRLLHQAWLQRHRYKFTLPPSYSALIIPGSVVRLPTFEQVQIETVNTGANFALECEGYLYDSSSYHYSITIPPDERPDSAYKDPTQEGSAELFLLDTNLISDADDDFGIYGFSSKDNTTLYLSADNGATYDAVYDFPSAATYGTCDTVLGGGVSPNLIDRTNQLTVTLTNGTLESINDLQFLNLENLAFIGRQINGVWKGEYVGFKNPVLLGENQYLISEWIRGCRGSEWFMDSHTAGEIFILLKGEDAIVDRLAANLGALGTPLSFKLVQAPWEDFNALTTYTLTPQGNSLKPYAPSHLKLILNSTTNDLILNWKQRPRKFNNWKDYVDAPTVDVPELYELTIYDGATPKRTVLTPLPAYTYLSSEQITDFGTNLTSLVVEVAQKSGYVGSGYSIRETIAVSAAF